MLKIFRQKEARKMDRYAQYAMVASEEAVTDAGFDFETLDKDRAGGFGIRYRWTRNFSNRNVEFCCGDGTPFNPFFIPK
jgi:3-oxoacyl-[acyl-carrier-protein] synthase II